MKCPCSKCVKNRKLDESKLKKFQGPFDCDICKVIMKLHVNIDCFQCAKEWKENKSIEASCPFCRRENVFFINSFFQLMNKNWIYL